MSLVASVHDADSKKVLYGASWCASKTSLRLVQEGGGGVTKLLVSPRRLMGGCERDLIGLFEFFGFGLFNCGVINKIIASQDVLCGSQLILFRNFYQSHFPITPECEYRTVLLPVFVSLIS